jgi:hypothetical protein
MGTSHSNPQLTEFCHPERSEGSAFSRQTTDPSPSAALGVGMTIHEKCCLSAALRLLPQAAEAMLGNILPVLGVVPFVFHTRFIPTVTLFVVTGKLGLVFNNAQKDRVQAATSAPTAVSIPYNKG